jgi:hypothetical protein
MVQCGRLHATPISRGYSRQQLYFTNSAMSLQLTPSRPIPLLGRCFGFRTPISECDRLGFDYDDSSYHMCE